MSKKIIGVTVGTPINPQKVIEQTEQVQVEQIKQNTKDISQLYNEIANLTTSGLTTAQVNALDGMFKKCAFTSDATTEYEAFKTAFGITGGGTVEPDEPDNPEITLTSISAVYNGGEVTVGTALTDLTGITVTGTYSDGSTANIIGYTLSGTIAEGNNTITVSYSGKTTTFTVTGIAESGGEDTDNENLMTTGDLGTFSDLGTYTGYDGYYDADTKTLQLTAKSGTTNTNAHFKITPFVEVGKSYTLFMGIENRKSSATSTGKVDYSTTTNYATNNLSSVTNSTQLQSGDIQYRQFTVPEDAVEVYMLISTAEHVDFTITNVALYEGTYTEMP